MDVERRPDFAIRVPAGDPAAPAEGEHDPPDMGVAPAATASRLAWATDACDGHRAGMLPETADLEGQPERRLVVDDYSSQVLGEHHPTGGPLEG